MELFCGSPFWVANFSSVRCYPDLPPCFQDTVMVWIPCGVLFILSPLYFHRLRTNPRKKPIGNTWLNYTKTVTGIFLAALALFDLFRIVDRHRQGHVVFASQLTAPGIQCLAMAMAVVIVQVEKKYGVHTSVLLLIFWLLYVISDMFLFRSRAILPIMKCAIYDPFLLVTSCTRFPLVLLQVILLAFVDRNPLVVPNEEICPFEDSSVLSKVTFWWTFGLLAKGYKKTLEVKDLWSIRHIDSCRSVVPRHLEQWKAEEQRADRSKKRVMGKDLIEESSIRLKEFRKSAFYTKVTTKTEYSPSILKTVFKASYWSIIISIGLKILQEILLFSSPQILSLLIGFMGSGAPSWHGYSYALALLLVGVATSIIQQHYSHHYTMTALHMKTAVMSMVYRKSLRLTQSARTESSTGEIVNLMSVDAARFGELVYIFNMTWSAPLQIILAMWFLWRILGPAVIVGLVTILLILPFNGLIVQMSKKFQIRQMNEKDSRIKMINEILDGIKVLKLYVWEKAFEEKVTKCRNREVDILRKFAYLGSTAYLIWSSTPFLVAVSSFAAYVISSPDNMLDAEKIFVSLSLFNILRVPLTHLPGLIKHIVQVKVAAERLDRFLTKEEKDPSNVIQDENEDSAISVDGASFTWDKGGPTTLENINFKVPAGQLVAVVGPIGAGKSSLINALLGEMYKLSGHVNLKGSVGYVAQQAWIQHATLKDNILFGKDTNNGLYKAVIEECALKMDIDMLPDGDLTEIGEKGINLSGGQKSRVSLARAVYQEADVYLLDDPLSAVDAHVGKHIFNKVIGKNGILKDKTRFLVTHDLHYLPEVDKIIVLADGKITEQGSYTELIAHAGPFAEFLKNYLFENYHLAVIQEQDDETRSIREEALTHIGNLREEWKASILSLSQISPRSDVPFPRVNIRRPRGRTLSASADLRSRGVRQRQKSGETMLMRQQSEMPSSLYNGVTYREKPHVPALDLSASHTGAVIREEMNLQASPRYSPRVPSTPSTPRFGAFFERQLSVCETIGSENLDGRGSAELGNLEQHLFETVECEGQDAKSYKEERSTSKMSSIKQDECLIIEDEPPNASSKLLVDEEIPQSGQVKLSVYMTYLRRVGVHVACLVVLLAIANSALSIGGSAWLAAWSDSIERMPANQTVDSERDLRLGVYGLLGLFQALFVSLSQGVGLLVGLQISKIQHAYLLNRVLHATMSFFDRTPVGRILNRFSRDIEVLNYALPNSILTLIRLSIHIVGSVIVISTVTPWALLVWALLSIIYIVVQRLYVRASRQLQRLECVNRSPVFSHFSESLNGITTIRAYKRQEQFIAESDHRIDTLNSCTFPAIACNKWLGINLEFMGNVIVLVASTLAVYGRDQLSAGLVGLSITYALNVTGSLTWFVRISSDLETQIISVERLKEYIDTPSEGLRIVTGNRPRAQWPEEGKLAIKKMSVTYREGLEPVLKSITCTFNSKEKIGIVGRSGAGKSTLTLALFRILETVRGKIKLDGINIAKIGLHDLRSKLTIIPQEPVIFSGTLRMNLDPFDMYLDDSLWNALEQAHLKDFVVSLPLGLYHECLEGGQNLSVGQRQLICLARALLRKTKVLIMDEATAAVDMETNELIQHTIKTEFADCTVLTIAHRLSTIMDYTKVLVLGAGEVLEFDSPSKLLADKSSVFYSMAQDAGLVE